MAIDNNMSEEDAFTTIIGEEHFGRVRSMGFGICPSQVLKSFGGSSSGSSSSQVTQLQSELEAERARVDALEKEVTKFKGMEEKLAFLMQHVMGQGFNQVGIDFDRQFLFTLALFEETNSEVVWNPP